MKERGQNIVVLPVLVMAKHQLWIRLADPVDLVTADEIDIA